MPLTTSIAGTRSILTRGGQRRRCTTCGVLRLASGFTPTRPYANCTWCRRVYTAKLRGKTAELDLLMRYRDVDDFLTEGLGRTWPTKLILAEKGFFAR